MSSRESFAQTTGAVVRKMRTEVGINITEASRSLGISQASYSHLEHGEREMTLYEFLALARALGFEPWEAIRKIRQELRA